ncbi:hypothetical protein LSTR_LSTR007693 [Laodelphax striatellus]|uniref:Uncharacterized protein n=1 Tax=Laodelphax striatellus TaxID=195883 RepID=A0A482WIQ8_LAOST|nr:hypothetical protein LSTR_LSTR007693 [Laodelphax striatellus]
MSRVIRGGQGPRRAVALLTYNGLIQCTVTNEIYYLTHCNVTNVAGLRVFALRGGGQGGPTKVPSNSKELRELAMPASDRCPGNHRARRVTCVTEKRLSHCTINSRRLAGPTRSSIAVRSLNLSGPFVYERIYSAEIYHDNGRLHRPTDPQLHS